jgi:hypothetical protein
VTDPSNIIKYGYELPISRGLAIDEGLIEPTDEERAEREREHAEYLAEVEAAKPQYEAAVEMLKGLGLADPHYSLAARLLHIHVNNDGDCADCWDGEDYATWPCDVARTIAEHYGTPFPERWLL